MVGVEYDPAIFEERDYKLHYKSTYAGKKISMPKGLETMESLFEDCFILSGSYLDESWDTSKIRNWRKTFKHCTIPTDFDLSRLDMSSAAYLDEMFMKAVLPRDVKLTASKVFSLARMFCECDASLGLEIHLGTSSVTNFSEFLANAELRNDFRLPTDFDTSRGTVFNSFFRNVALPEGFSLPQAFNTSKAEDMSNFFGNCTHPTCLKFSSGWDMSNASEMNNMFFRSKGIVSNDENFVKGFSTENAINIDGLFQEVDLPENPAFIEKLDITKTNSLNSLFAGCTIRNGFKLPETFNTKHIGYFSNMFQGAVITAEDFQLPKGFVVNDRAEANFMFDNITVKGIQYSQAPSYLLEQLKSEDKVDRASTVKQEQQIAFIMQAIDQLSTSLDVLTKIDLIKEYLNQLVKREVPCTSDLHVEVWLEVDDSKLIRICTAHHYIEATYDSVRKDVPNLDTWLLKNAKWKRKTKKVDYSRVLNIPAATLQFCTTEEEFLEVVRKYVNL